MISLQSNSKIRVRRLKNPELRKIRYELRTLLFLEYEKRKKDFYENLGLIRKDLSLSYKERKDKLIRLRKERESLNFAFHRGPISCWYCGDRMVDLVRDPESLFWFCNEHFRSLHKL